MKKKYLFALVLAGLALSSCSQAASVGVKYDDADLDIDTPWVDYSIPVTEVEFEAGQSDKVLNRGETYEYLYSVAPAKAKKESLIWTSSDESVVTVNKGVITAVDAGTAYITVSNNELTFEPIDLTVSVVVPLSDINFDSQVVACDFNDTAQLNVTLTPSDTTQRELLYRSSDESIATVDANGLVSTYENAGTATIYASSPYINKVISISIEVQDRTVYPTSVVLDSYETEVEIGHSFTMSAHVLPENATHKEVIYRSTNPAILSVEEDTGVVHALGDGNAEIYAVSAPRGHGLEGLVSDKVLVSVYEVKVASIILDDITLSNKTGMSDVEIPMTYTTDKVGHDEASIPQFSYEVANTDIVVVNNGKLYAKAVGTTTLTVSEARSGLSKTVNVTVKYVAEKVAVTGPSQVYLGETGQLTTTIEPSGVPATLVTYTSSNEDVLTVSETGLVTAKTVGTATVTASVLGLEADIEIEVLERTLPFMPGQYYVVGSSSYRGGESTNVTGGSWNSSNHALRFTELVQEPHDTLRYEYRGVINFREGDLWKIRGYDSYFDIYGWPDGATYQLGEYKITEGAFAGTTPDMSVDEGNIKVNRAGCYAIYYAHYDNDHVEGWYSIYVERHELTISDVTPQVKAGTSTTIEAHNWKGELKYEITSGEDLITVARDDYQFTITAGDTLGEATIRFYDEATEVIVTVTVSNEEPPAKTFEAGIPYIVGNADYHSGVATGTTGGWGSDASKAFKAIPSTEPVPSGVFAQYEAQITFSEHNEFKVVIGGETLYWDARYQTSEGAFATEPKQMDQATSASNVVVLVGGTYKLYIKCLENDGGWEVYIAPASDVPVPPGPTEDIPDSDGYYVVGSKTNFKFANAPKMADAENVGDVAQLKGYEAKDGEKIKVRGYFRNETNPDKWSNFEPGKTKTFGEIDGDGNFVFNKDVTVDIYAKEIDNQLYFDVVGPEEPVPPGPDENVKTFYFTNNYKWDNLHVYYWKDQGTVPHEWPGVEMTYVYTNDMGESVYSIDIDVSLYDKVIFNTTGDQTVDISISSFGTNNACYISGGNSGSRTVGFWNYVG